MIERMNAWLNVPFVKNSSSKFGCDCLGLILAFYANFFEENLTLKNKINKIKTINNHLVLYNKMLDILKKHFLKIEFENIKTGDIIISKINGNIHFSLYYQNHQMLEANNIFNKVILSSINETKVMYICRIA